MLKGTSCTHAFLMSKVMTLVNEMLTKLLRIASHTLVNVVVTVTLQLFPTAFEIILVG